jgi:hypothetical protein
MTSLVLSMVLFTISSFELIKDFQATFVSHPDKAEVTLSWDFVHPEYVPENIVVLHGKAVVAMLPGDATTWTTDEKKYGAHQYTVAWLWKGGIYDYKTGVLNLGQISWKKPPMTVDPSKAGYYAYILPSADPPSVPPEPVYDTKEINPTAPFDVTVIPFFNLFDLNVLPLNEETYIALATYVYKDLAIPVVSPLSLILPFTYNDKTWEVPELPMVPEQPVIIW